jgi:bifunctional non-homologous end joining protein LigD
MMLPMVDFLQQLSADVRAKLHKRAQPSWIAPMLATLTEQRFSRDNWFFEPKLDGERCLAFRHGKDLRLMSRNELALNDQYPELVAALMKQRVDDFIVDGEIVAFEGEVTSFTRMQGRMHISNPPPSLIKEIPVFYYLFDLLYLDGHDTTRLALRDRKRLLKAAFAFKDPLRWTDHREREGEEFYREACRKGWEGLIAKRADGPYRSGRSTDWLKFKCVAEQEFVVGGFTDPQGSRIGFGALLVGYYEDGELHYAGKVGTGYDDETLRRLHKMLSSLETDKRPFVERDFPRKGVHWVKPKLVCEVGFSEWTPDGKLRHPRFLGLRDDKKPKDVVREKPRR